MLKKDSLKTTELLYFSNSMMEELGMKIENINLVIGLLCKPPDLKPLEFTGQSLINN